MKSEKREKLILACIEKFGMTPDSAYYFVQEFPNTAYMALMNAKVGKVKVIHYNDNKTCNNKSQS